VKNKVNDRQQQHKTWGGAAGYLSVTPVDGFTLSYRLDYFDDKQRARGLLGVVGNTGMGVDRIPAVQV
jgi:hypothetical protein